MSRVLDAATEPASESRFAESQWLDQLARVSGDTRWMGWRLRLLMAAALLGSIALFLLARWLGDAQHVDATWRTDAQGRIELQASAEPSLRPYVGQTLTALSGADGSRVDVDALMLRRSARWLIDDAERERHIGLHTRVARLIEQGSVTLYFAAGSASDAESANAFEAKPAGSVQAPLQRRGSSSLGSVFWLFGAFALVLYLVAMVVVLARPTFANLLYAVMALCQTGNLVLIAIESTLALALPPPMPALDMPLRMGFDLATAAAIVTAVSLHPRRLPGAGYVASGAWAAAAAFAALPALPFVSAPWWWMQAAVLVLGTVAIGLLSWSLARAAHPFTLLMRRLGIVTLVTLTLLIAASAMTSRVPRVQYDIASIGSMIWYVFFGALLLLLPFLSKSQQIVREFSLLAAISTVATSLDLLFVAVFSLGQFASLTLSLFLSLGVYAGVRQWLLNQLLGNSMLTTERMFEQLYRIARDVEAHPDRTAVLLSTLLRDLFEPMEVIVVPRRLHAARVVHAGAALILPVPQLGGDGGDDDAQAPLSIALHFAGRGRRLFTSEDARLADRIVEQLRRAVAFDKAVEQGRSEERTRIAQDLHDDIGARLLTLMYKAPTPEMEEYLRHTLKDLKTLTRGLAASNHRLSHAAAEWKADLSQRLTVAQIELGWHFRFDDDMLLSVVQWSALTRVLRELISNTIAHSQATRVDIRFELQADRLQLTVTDDGIGRNPRSWSHGLGLGGVRKRVKQLGGEVEWRNAEPHGVTCVVTLQSFSTPR